jgi:hypothetical protein
MAVNDYNMTFTSERQPDPEDRARRGLGAKTLMLDAIESECGSKDEFFRRVVQIGLGENGAPPVPMLISEALKRVEPPLKPSGERIKLDIPEGATHEQKALVVFHGVSDGNLTPEQGQMLIGMIKDTITISESTELIKRLDALEAALAKANK